MLYEPTLHACTVWELMCCRVAGLQRGRRVADKAHAPLASIGQPCTHARVQMRGARHTVTIDLSRTYASTSYACKGAHVYNMTHFQTHREVVSWNTR